MAEPASLPEERGAPGLPPTPAARPSFRRALRSRPFFLLWLSQLISQSGDFIFDVALLWLVLETTGSVLDVSLVVVATLIPVVLLGPVIGVYVDRWPRRSLLLGTNAAEAAIVATLSGLVLAHAASLPLLIAIVVALGIGGQVVRTTSSALVPQTVATGDLPPANSLLSFSSSANQVVGLSIGGIAVALFGVAVPIEYDAATFAAAALILLGMSAAVGRPEAPPAGADVRFSSQFGEGLAYVRRERFLIELIVLGLAVNFCANAVFALWAPYADLVLHGGAATYGFLGASVAVGAIVGAALIGKVNTQRSAGTFLFAGAGGIGVMIVVLGLTRAIPFALGEAVLVGGLLSVTNVPLLVVIQAKVPARLMGRVMSVVGSLILAASPVGAFFSGAIASATSIGFVYEVAGAIMIVIVAVGSLTMRALRTVTY